MIAGEDDVGLLDAHRAVERGRDLVGRRVLVVDDHVIEVVADETAGRVDLVDRHLHAGLHLLAVGGDHAADGEDAHDLDAAPRPAARAGGLGSERAACKTAHDESAHCAHAAGDELPTGYLTLSDRVASQFKPPLVVAMEPSGSCGGRLDLVIDLDRGAVLLRGLVDRKAHGHRLVGVVDRRM